MVTVIQELTKMEQQIKPKSIRVATIIQQRTDMEATLDQNHIETNRSGRNNQLKSIEVATVIQTQTEREAKLH